MSRRVEAAQAALLVLAAVLPFEVEQGVPVGPFSLTTTEAALYAMLVLWAVAQAPRWGAPWSRLHTCTLAWSGASLASAALAAVEPAAALKFALRVLAGCAAFFAAADLCVSQQVRSRVALALITGAAIAGLAAFGEVAAPGMARALLVFKPTTFHAEGLLRASGSFPYPNVAAAYQAAILGLALAWAARNPASRLARAASLASLLVLIAAIVLSGSRTGIGVAIIVMIGLWLSDRRGALGLRRPAALGLVGLSALVAAGIVAQPGLAARFRLRGDGPWYRADYVPEVATLSLGAGERISMRVDVRNRGAIDWLSAGRGAVLIGSSWSDALGRVVAEGPQAPLPIDVPQDAAATVEVPVRAPETPGAYTLGWQIGPPGLTWGSALGSHAGQVLVRVEPAAAGAGLSAPQGRRPIQRQATRFELWRVGLEMWRARPLTGVGPDNFRRLYAGYLGPKPLDERVRTNNVYVGALAETGLLGGLALVSLLGALVQLAVSALRARRPSKHALEVVGPTAALAALLLHGLLDDLFHMTATATLFWLLAGLLVGSVRKQR